VTEQISGADPCSQLNSVDKQETNNPEWQRAKTRGRWAEYFDPKTRTYRPPSSPARTKARAAKYAWARLSTAGDPAHVPLSRCLSGDELLAERECVSDGSFWLQPRTDDACELVALLPHGKLRWLEGKMLAAIAYAMLVRHKHGLVATLDELGALCGLRKSAVGESMRRLIALGFVRRDATYTKFGACESQRGNLWRITSDCERAFRVIGPLDVPDGVVLPQGTVDRERLLYRRGACSTPAPACAPEPAPSPGIATPRNPATNPESVTPSENIAVRSGMATAPRSRGEVRAKPPQIIFSLPDESHLRSLPETRQGKTCSVSGRAKTEAGSTEFLDELAELVSDPSMRAAMRLAARKGGGS
jgi:hypothetical protein